VSGEPRYSYVRNSPTRLIDPSGTFAQDLLLQLLPPHLRIPVELLSRFFRGELEERLGPVGDELRNIRRRGQAAVNRFREIAETPIPYPPVLPPQITRFFPQTFGGAFVHVPLFVVGYIAGYGVEGFNFALSANPVTGPAKAAFDLAGWGKDLLEVLQATGLDAGALFQDLVVNPLQGAWDWLTGGAEAVPPHIVGYIAGSLGFMILQTILEELLLGALTVLSGGAAAPATGAASAALTVRRIVEGMRRFAGIRNALLKAPKALERLGQFVQRLRTTWRDVGGLRGLLVRLRRAIGDGWRRLRDRLSGSPRACCTLFGTTG
jgi:hypothetical protein